MCFEIQEKKVKKSVKIDMHSTITTLLSDNIFSNEFTDDDFFDDNDDIINIMKKIILPDDDNSVNEISFSTDGYISEENGCIELSYKESELTGFEGSSTLISFNQRLPNQITMVRNGSYSTLLVFNSDVKRQRCVYNLNFLPPFELNVYTKYIKNNMTFSGGEIIIDYFIEMAGIKTEYSHMYITVNEI